MTMQALACCRRSFRRHFLCKLFEFGIILSISTTMELPEAVHTNKVFSKVVRNSMPTKMAGGRAWQDSAHAFLIANNHCS